MSRIQQAFAANKQKGSTTLVPFITMGDPDLETSVDIIAELEKAGADVVELGVPYSDPLADGPVIQESSQRALQHGVTILDVVRTARTCRERGIQLPFILFTYYNPVLQMGPERFIPLLKENGIDGLIIPDLPIEENGDVYRLCLEHGLDLIPLVAPTSHERIRNICSTAMGFIYCISSLGVTGTRSEFYRGLEPFVEQVKQATDLPVAIGFGISNREQVERLGQIADGVVIGSAIVRKIGETIPLLIGGDDSRVEGLRQIREFVGQFKV